MIDASPEAPKPALRLRKQERAQKDENDDPLLDELLASPGINGSPSKRTTKKKVSSRKSDVSLPPASLVDDDNGNADEYDFDDDFLVPDDDDENREGDYDRDVSACSDSEEDEEEEIETPPAKSKTKVTASKAPVKLGSILDKTTTSEREFLRERATFAQRFYAELNDRVFGGKLPRDMTLRWRKTKAVVGLFVWKRQDGVESFYITLARNYLTTQQILVDTLAHEMCHAAARLIDNDTDRSHHGPVWWKWARTVMASYKGRISITVKCSEEH